MLEKDKNSIINFKSLVICIDKILVNLCKIWNSKNRWWTKCSSINKWCHIANNNRSNINNKFQWINNFLYNKTNSNNNKIVNEVLTSLSTVLQCCRATSSTYILVQLPYDIWSEKNRAFSPMRRRPTHKKCCKKWRAQRAPIKFFSVLHIFFLLD